MEVTRYQKGYREYKAELDMEVSRAAEGFVRIGYLLKVARDTRVLYESPYDNVVDFAQAEYGIDKTQVSRFININDRFSEGGYSDRLQDRYKGYGVAKLALMLQLPDAVNGVLSPSYSKEEIRMVKEEVDAERGVTDLEVMMEARQEPAGGGSRGDTLRRAIWKLGEDEPGLYREVYRVFRDGGQVQALQEALAPDGERTYSIRIAGVGRVLLSLRDGDGEVVLVNIRTGEKECHTWEDMGGAWRAIMPDAATAGEGWEKTYGGRMPGEKAGAGEAHGSGGKPVQGQKKKSGKVVRAGAAGKKQGKGAGTPKGYATKASTGENGAGCAGDEADTMESPGDGAGDMQGAIPGQMGVQDYPELLPDGEATEAGAEPAGVAPVQLGRKDKKKKRCREEHLQYLEQKLGDLYRAALEGEWGQADRIMGEVGGILAGIRALGR